MSLKCAEKSMVLLKNDGVLPLDKNKLNSIAVIGPNAASVDALIGNYSGTSCRNVTFLEGIETELGDNVRVFYSEGCSLCSEKVEHLALPDDRLSEAVAMAKASDVSVLCLGFDASIEGEEGDEGNAFAGGDKLTLSLPVTQQRLLDAVCSVGKPVIVVLATGSSVNVGDDRPAAILQAWYPGEAGGTALANILFGKVSPSGKLPVTFYESADRLPEFTDYSMAGRTYRYTSDNVLYPFGFGLTYSDLHADSIRYERGKVYVTVQNSGARDTEDVLQLYIRDTESPFEVPRCKLCGFKRIRLGAGETMEFEMVPYRKAYTVVDDDGNRIPGSGKYRVWAGFCSPGEKGEQLCGHECKFIDIERQQ